MIDRLLWRPNDGLWSVVIDDWSGWYLQCCWTKTRQEFIPLQLFNLTCWPSWKTKEVRTWSWAQSSRQQPWVQAGVRTICDDTFVLLNRYQSLSVLTFPVLTFPHNEDLLSNFSFISWRIMCCRCRPVKSTEPTWSVTCHEYKVRPRDCLTSVKTCSL